MTRPLVAFTRGFAAPVSCISVQSFLAPAWIPATSYHARQMSRNGRRPTVRSPNHLAAKLQARELVLDNTEASTVADSKGKDQNGTGASVPPEPRPASLARTPADHSWAKPLPYPLSLFRNHRGTSSRGLLSTLGQQEDGLDAFTLLAQALLKLEPKAAPERMSPTTISQHSPWSHDSEASTSLADRTYHLCNFDRSYIGETPTATLQELSEAWNGQNRDEEAAAYREAISELWCALGEITIRASSLAENEAEQLMEHAHVVFALMHSKGLVPLDIYGFEESNVPKTRRKPPYLHILGSRMMATMSEASWKAQSRDQPGMRDSFDPPVPSVLDEVNPRVRKLHPSLWLEFVLWSCVNQGYFVEAARLLSQACIARANHKWKALSWVQVLELQTHHDRRQQSWFDRLMTLEEGYNEDRPLIEMPAKTISIEAVLSILDGLLSLPEHTSAIRPARRIAFYIYCQSALSNPVASYTLALNSLSQQFAEASDLDPATIFDLFFSLSESPTSRPQDYDALKHLEKDNESGFWPFAVDQEQARPLVNHLIASFDAQVLRGDVMEALATFEQIRKVPRDVLAPLDMVLSDPKDPEPQSLDPASLSYSSLTQTGDTLDTASNQATHIPSSTLSAFLKLVISTDRLDIARVLLYEDVFIPRSEARNPVMQPALLQAAVALSDRDLIAQVVEHFHEDYDSMSDGILLAVYETHITLQNYYAARRLLVLLGRERRLALPPRLVTVTACHYITVANAPVSDAEASGSAIQRLLVDILNGSFLPRRDPSTPIDYQPQRLLAQLTRIFRNADPALARLPGLRKISNADQLNIAIHIPADAFNPLLETLAKFKGAGAAQRLFDEWCSELRPEPPVLPTYEGIPVVRPQFEGERVVTPTLESVEIVLHAALTELRGFYDDPSKSRLQISDPARRLLRWVDSPTLVSDLDLAVRTKLPLRAPNRELLEWGAQTLRRMGLNDFGINAVIPGAFPDAETG